MFPAAIEEHLDVADNIAPSLLPCPVQPMVGSFALQTAEESLHNRIVPTVALAAHAAHNPIPFKDNLGVVVCDPSEPRST